MQAIAAKANEATKQIDHTDGLQLGMVSSLTSAITTIELLRSIMNGFIAKTLEFF